MRSIYFQVDCIVVVLLLIGSGSTLSQEAIDPPVTLQKEPDPSAANKSAVTSQDLIAQLVREMDELIPGEYPEGSPQVRRLNDIASFFVAGNQPKVRNSLAELAQEDSRVPPQDLLLAGLAFATNNPMQGKFLLERAGTNYREHPAIALAFGRLALAQGRAFDAQALIEKAQSLTAAAEYSEDIRNYYDIESLNTLTVIETRRNDLQRAEEFAKMWEQLDPKDDRMLLAFAEIEFRQDRIDSSVEYLSRRSAERQQELPTEIVIAKWYRNKNDLENLSKWINDAYKKHSSNPATQMEYAAWLLRQEDLDSVESVIETFESEYGESADSRLVKGRLAFARQDYAAAEALFAGLYQQQPNNLENSYLFILSLLESRDPQKSQQAVAIAQRNFQVFPNNQLAIAAMGWALLKAGKTQPGRQLLERASKTGNLMPDTTYFLAQMMYREQQKIQAKIILEPFINTPDIFLFRGRAKQLLNSITSEKDLPPPEKDK